MMNWEVLGKGGVPANSRYCPGIRCFISCLVNSSIFIRSLFNVAISRLGHVVTQLVEALRYKPEGRGFDSRWCYWNFSLT